MENEYLFQHGFKCAPMCKGKTQDLKKQKKVFEFIFVF